MRKTMVCSLLLLLSLIGGRALAHARLVAAEPKAWSRVAEAPSRLRLRFNQVVRLAGTGVALVPSDGRPRLLGPLTRDPKDVRAILVPLPPGLTRGRYAVRWRALSPDAHRSQGDFAFTVGP